MHRLLATLLVLSACSRPSPSGSGSAPGDEAQSAQQSEDDEARTRDHIGSVAAEGERRFLFPESRPPLSKQAIELREKLHPQSSGWPSEARAFEARETLQAFLETLFSLEGPPGEQDEFLAAFLAPTFAGVSALRPAEAELLLEDDSLRVESAAITGEELVTGSEAQAHLAALGESFRGTSELRVDLHLVDVQVSSEIEFRVQLLWHASARRDNSVVQANGEWELEMVAREEGRRPEVQAIRARYFDEIQASSPLFAELSQSLFAPLACFAREYELGVDAYFRDMDWRTGSAFLGSQGMAIGDVDGDGLDDLYVCQQGGIPNRLFRHAQDGSLVDITEASGAAWLDTTRSALLLDLNDDGHQDLVLAMGSALAVGEGNGKGVFANWKKLESKNPAEIFSISAADPDLDGDLDLFSCRHIQGGMMGSVPVPYHDAVNGAPNEFWRNEGQGRFVLATREVGLDENNHGFTLASIWEDFDDDGDPDLYLTNDFGRNSYYRNEGGRFREVAEEIGAVDQAAGMGASASDFDLDGDMDLYVSNMFSAAGQRVVKQAELFMPAEDALHRSYYEHHSRGNTVLENLGDGTFRDVTNRAGARVAGWSWGGLFFDFNNDGFEDLYVPNGFVSGTADSVDNDSFYWREVISRSPKAAPAGQEYSKAWSILQSNTMEAGQASAGNERNAVFLNTGQGRFVDVGAASGADRIDDARVVASTDWDGDGRVDFFVKNRTAPRLRFFHNRDRSGQHWLSLSLQASTGARDAIGARVVVELADKSLRKSLYAGDGYLSQSSKWLHFGLGHAQSIERVSVRWPGGAQSEYTDLAVDRRYRLVEGENTAQPVQRPVHEMAKRQDRPWIIPAGDADRIVLVERLPLAPLGLPAFEDPARRVANLVGQPTLIVLWSLDAPACEPVLAELAGLSGNFEAVGLQVLPQVVDGVREHERALSLLQGLGLDSGSGFMGSQRQQDLLVILSHVRGNAFNLQLPVSLLIDDRGGLVVIYTDGLDWEVVQQDVQALARIPRSGPGSPSTEVLMGGRWMRTPPRNYQSLVTRFSRLGRPELAAFYARFTR